MLGFQSGWWRKRLCVNSMSPVDVVAKKSAASSGGRNSCGHLLGSQFCVWCRVSFFKVFLSLFLHLSRSQSWETVLSMSMKTSSRWVHRGPRFSRGPSHYPVSCQDPARTHCPGAPSLTAHRDTGLRALQQTTHAGLVVFSISTVVFLQNLKRAPKEFIWASAKISGWNYLSWMILPLDFSLFAPFHSLFLLSWVTWAEQFPL